MKRGTNMPASCRRRGRRPGWRTGTALGLTLVLAAACSGGDGHRRRAAAPSARVIITPWNGTVKARPDVPIMVQVLDGTLQDVTVTTNGTRTEGDQSADGSRWRSRWNLDPGTRYHVVATALGRDGRTRTAMSYFTTLKAEHRLVTTIEAPVDKETVGVGMPIILNFDRNVRDKAAVERVLEVRSTHPVEGAWRWFGDRQLIFRTRKHWPPRSEVELAAHMSGVRAAANVFGVGNSRLRFRIGDEHSSVADAKTHQMVVKRNGRQIRKIPISMGKGGLRKYTTTSGNHLTMDKARAVLMDSATVGCPPGCPNYYRQIVYWAVRISNSGEYNHSAPWSVASQGVRNVSHGCVNMSPANATWFFNFSYRGDPYKIIGTDRELEPDNGWGYWQLSWPAWVAGGASKRSVTTGRIAPAVPVR